jgi:iron complex outermembrane recepter protein
MSKINQLSNAIKFALFIGATASLASVSAFAQDKEEETKELKRVEVIGSRIKRVDAETAQPVSVITRADIEKTGATSVYDVLNNITSSDGSGLSTVTTQTNGSDGSQQISLRNLGAERTLVLVDGKRWVTDIDGVVDLSTVPLAIIERIDVLKDGASAIYGSDAIGGVVNIVTRKNYDGAQIGVSYGQRTKGDGATNSADITIGASGERSNGVLSVSYSSQEPIFAGDREISNEPFAGCFDYYGGVCPFGSSSSQFGRFYTTGTGTTGPSLTLNPNANIADGIQAGDLIPFTNAARYNFSPINYLQQPAKRANIFAAGRFDITDSVSAYVRASYTKRTSVQQLAEVPATFAVNGASGPQWAFGIAPNSIFNPLAAPINGGFFRNSAVGPRRPSYDYDIFSLQMGIEGDFQIGERAFSWDLAAQRNDGQYDSKGENYINLFNLRNALGQSGYDAASNTLYCGASFATRIRNCIPYQIFGGPTLGLGSQIPGAPAGRVITAAEVQQMIDYVSYTQVSTAGNTTLDYTGNISGDLFELPGGMMSFAVGFERRTDNAFSQPDALVAGGGSSDNFSEPTSGKTEVTEYFAELVVPLLKDVFLAKELELRAAARKSDYEAGGFVGANFVAADPGSPTNAMFGLKWKPIDDLLIRANWGENFRAPSAFDLYQGGQEGFPQASDPCRSAASVGGATSPFVTNPTVAARCIALGVPAGGALQNNSQIRTLGGGNPNLKPEFGTNLTVGFVYSPEWVEGLDLSIDYYRIELKDVQSTLTAGTILNRCVGSAGVFDPSLCSFIQRSADGSLATVRTSRFNSAENNQAGIDLGVGYRWDAGDWGNFRFKWDITKVLKDESRADVTSVLADAVGSYGGAPSFEYRSVFTADWTKGDWTASWTTRYLSDLYEYNCGFLLAKCGGDAPNLVGGVPDGTISAASSHTGSYAVHDISLAWKAPWDARISVGARNVFGKEPPILYNSFAHSFDASYDLPGGGTWFAQYRQDF